MSKPPIKIKLLKINVKKGLEFDVETENNEEKNSISFSNNNAKPTVVNDMIYKLFKLSLL